MTGRPFDGESYTLTYDGENRLIGISGTGLNASYTYDGDGQRVKSVVTFPSETHTTGYVGDYFEVALGTPLEPPVGDPPDCAVSYCMFFPMVQSGMGAPPGEAWMSYYYAGGQRVAQRVQSNMQELNSALYYFLTDHLGSTTVTLDAGGNPFSELRYKAWGESPNPVGVTPTTFKYTGQREAEAGLYDYKSRFYDPILGRFTSPDSLIPEPGNAPSWDHYSYAQNNPLRYTDPSGHFIFEGDWQDPTYNAYPTGPFTSGNTFFLNPSNAQALYGESTPMRVSMSTLIDPHNQFGWYAAGLTLGMVQTGKQLYPGWGEVGHRDFMLRKMLLMIYCRSR